MWQKIKCFIGLHEYIGTCQYCEEHFEEAFCERCSFFMFPKKICKHCGRVKKK